MEPISIEICTGTACFVMGGADLLLLNDELLRIWAPHDISQKEIDKVLVIKGKTCTGHCRVPGMRPPFVLIDDVLIGEATISMIAEVVLPGVQKRLGRTPDKERSC